MLNKLKHKYNKWLYKKYGMDVKPGFENIPLIFRLRPLFSPSIYFGYVGDELLKPWTDWVEQEWDKLNNKWLEEDKKGE